MIFESRKTFRKEMHANWYVISFLRISEHWLKESCKLFGFVFCHGKGQSNEIVLCVFLFTYQMWRKSYPKQPVSGK